MKNLFLAVALILSLPVLAQVPNGSFENWTSGLNSLTLDDWETTPCFLPCLVNQDTAKCHGAMGLIMASNTFIRTGFAVPITPSKISFCMGLIFDTGGPADTVKVTIKQYLGGSEIFSQTEPYWGDLSSMPGPVFDMSIPITYGIVAPDSMSVEFIGGKHANTYNRLDNVRTDVETGVTEVKKERTALQLFPDPLTDESLLHIDADVINVYIYNIEGKLVRHVQPTSATLTIQKGDLQPGLYFIVTENSKKQRNTGRFLVK